MNVCTQVVKILVRQVFTYGSVLDATSILLRFLQSPEIRELTQLGSHKGKHAYWDSMQAIVDNVSNYLNGILETKGPRTTANQRAYRTVLAACAGPNLVESRIQTKAASVLQVHFRNIKRGVQDRRKLEEEPGSGYVMCTRKTYRNKMPDKVWSILDDFLHSDLASRQDNYRKRKVVLSLPPDPDTGDVPYCVHWQRELRSNWKTLFVLLTGRDVNNNRIEGMEPSSWWKQIIKLTTTEKRPHGIKGSPAMLKKKACRCLAGACISQCSCPHCTHFLENLDHRHLAVHCGWRKVKPGVGECKECGGACHDPKGAWLNMSGGLVPFITNMLCPAVPVPGVYVRSVDPLTGLEIPGEVAPVKMIRKECWLGRCKDCGWNNRFANFPKLPVKVKEDDDTERTEFVHACPREARLDRNTTYHQFKMMERGLTKDGKPYTQSEWTPVTSDRRTFYYQLYSWMQNFLPHYYKVRWHETFEQVFVQLYKRLAFTKLTDQTPAPESMKGSCVTYHVCT